MITPQTPWRSIPTGPAARYASEFRRLVSPMLPDAEFCWSAARPFSYLLLAMSWCESKYARISSIPPAYRNPLSLKGPPDGSGERPWMAFDAYPDCYEATAQRIASSTYGGGIYARTTTLAELVRTFAPPEDGNDVKRYVADVCALLNQWIEEDTVSDLVFGKVPHPACTKDILAPGVRADGDGWNSMGRDRRNFGVVYHRTVGRSIAGTGEWFRNPGTGLTHYGVGSCPPDAGPDGKVYQWVDPRSRVSPWASGPWENPPGDGRALVAKYGVEAINGDLIAIETSGYYDDPISDTTRQRIAEISAYWADQAKIPYDVYPLNPTTGLTYTYWHNEFQGHKPCPGSVIQAATNDVIARTKDILKQYQTGETTVPPPTPDLDYPPGWDAAIAAAVWGDAYPEYRFDEGGVISGLWLEHEITSPLVYHFKDTTDGRELFVFANGSTIGRLNSGEAYRLLV